jgi:hypothetical protein
LLAGCAIKPAPAPFPPPIPQTTSETFALVEEVPADSKPPTHVVLSWSYPTISDAIVFNVYSHTNLHVPIRFWPKILTVKTTETTLPLELGSRFFYVTASNETTRLESLK